MEDIRTFSEARLEQDEEQAQGTVLQKRVGNLFSGLLNPTLPSAYKLRDCALQHNFYVDPRVLQRIASLENVHS